ncbi:MAG: M15 family metallopeptidase [Pseudomonadota bacterium]
MISSRLITDLHPKIQPMAQQLIDDCRAQNIDLIITSSYRDVEAQNAIYSQGRTKPGAIVTNAQGGHSFHNYRVAIDVVPIINGKCDWSGTSDVWQKIITDAKVIGFEWAGDWITFKERAHFQYTQGLSIQDFLDGKNIQ